MSKLIAPKLSAGEIRKLRQKSLLLVDSAFSSVLDITRWFGAMQAQDLNSAKWSYGVRIPGATEVDIDDAIASGEVLRTWPMRGTIHFIPSQDARWMLELTGVRSLSGAAKRREFLGLTLADVERAAEVLSTELPSPMLRSDVMNLLISRGLDVTGQRGYHILWYASQIGVTCIGPSQGKEQTFVCLDSFAPKQNAMAHDEALATLAIRYFQSHGPAPYRDLMGWTGLPARDIKVGIELAGDQLESADFAGTPMWFRSGLRDQKVSAARLELMPGFDEFMLGYKDRDLIVEPEFANSIVPGGNGMFKPTINNSGQAIGIWSRKQKSKSVDIAAQPFAPFSKAQRDGFSAAAGRYADYLGLAANVP